LFLFKIIKYGDDWLRKSSEIPTGHEDNKLSRCEGSFHKALEKRRVDWFKIETKMETNKVRWKSNQISGRKHKNGKAKEWKRWKDHATTRLG